MLKDTFADGTSEVAFVDNNTSKAVPGMLKALKDDGLTPEEVRYIIVTHVHLDHCAGTRSLLDACPNATVLAHPRAARHLIDPTRLIAGSEMVYGKEGLRALYGDIQPVPENRVEALEDNVEKPFGNVNLQFFHTRGHAKHHLSIFDPLSMTVFAGDSFGVCYEHPWLPRERFIVPSASPVDFEPDEAVKSVEKIYGTGCDRVCIAHYGTMSDLTVARENLLRGIEYYAKLYEEAKSMSEPIEEIGKQFELRLIDYVKGIANENGLTRAEGVQLAASMKVDLELNGQGIAIAAARDK
eukprot:GFYU01010637.1.p1 GENE.GFYU01010637.1~~GFYU01010637.1.p1  ORF type:complete len:297 (+),score=49.17 GFYU01010637.1:182-1072(+)